MRVQFNGKTSVSKTDYVGSTPATLATWSDGSVKKVRFLLTPPKVNQVLNPSKIKGGK